MTHWAPAFLRPARARNSAADCWLLEPTVTIESIFVRGLEAPVPAQCTRRYGGLPWSLGSVARRPYQETWFGTVKDTHPRSQLYTPNKKPRISLIQSPDGASHGGRAPKARGLEPKMLRKYCAQSGRILSITVQAGKLVRIAVVY
jgi:hypothetical protein